MVVGRSNFLTGGIKTSTYSPRCLETGKVNLIHRHCLLTSGHLLCEKDDHLGEVDGSGGLADHAGGFSVWDWSSDWGESGLQVAGGEDTVLKIGNLKLGRSKHMHINPSGPQSLGSYVPLSYKHLKREPKNGGFYRQMACLYLKLFVSSGLKAEAP